MLSFFVVCLCTGEIRWQQPQPSGLYSTVPVLNVPDLDGDKLSDVALVASDHTQVHSNEAVYSPTCICFLLYLMLEGHSVFAFLVFLQS